MASLVAHICFECFLLILSNMSKANKESVGKIPHKKQRAEKKQEIKSGGKELHDWATINYLIINVLVLNQVEWKRKALKIVEILAKAQDKRISVSSV